MNTFWRELYESFTRIRGAPATLLGILLGAVYFGLSANTATLPIKVLPLVIVPTAVLLMTLFDCSYRMYFRSNMPLPSVKQARPPPGHYPNAKSILLIDDNPLFAHETLVSVYYLDNSFEVLIGTGFVLTKQKNGLTQVLITLQIEGHAAIWNKAANNDSLILQNLIVKPSVPRILLED